MLREALDPLPGWAVEGVLLGVVVSLLIAGLFYVAVRRFPQGTDSDRSWTTDERRRAEIRGYLRSIGERYAEDHPVEGQRVAFYLPERGVAITFDARAFYRLERSEVEGVLVEHEMPGTHLGERLPFETPGTAVGSGDDSEGASGDTARDAAFAALGIPAGASPEQVKRAYRRRVKETHPDHGGDREEFERVREAYATARRRVE